MKYTHPTYQHSYMAYKPHSFKNRIIDFAVAFWASDTALVLCMAFAIAGVMWGIMVAL